MPCTVLIAARTATQGPMLAHSLDTAGCVDVRLVRVPASNNPVSPRPVFHYNENYVPRFRGKSRGDIPEYLDAPGPGEDTNPMGEIPQVQATLGYWEAHSGIINSKGVMIAESTCSSIFSAAPPPKGKALLGYEDLTRVALERCSTAKEAVDLMGSLAVEYGFYGNSLDLPGSAESLAVADAEEAWIFHILPDDTGASAVWAAQRVPDGEATAVANMFIIRTMDLKDQDNYRFSRSALDVAIKLKLWTPGETFDFARIFSAGEARNRHYSGRRMWRAMSMMSPSKNLPAHYEDLLQAPAYPFSVVPDKPLNRHDMFRILRDTYHGTCFDLSQQMAAGPFGIVDRYDGHETTATTFERPVGTARMKYSYVCEHRLLGDPILWFGQHVSVTSVYLPVLLHMRKSPDPLVKGWMMKLDRISAYWAFRYVKHLALMRWDRCITAITERQMAWEQKASSLVDMDCAKETMEADLNALCSEVVADWWAFADELMVRFGDGWEYDGKTGIKGGMPLEYPSAWLEKSDVKLAVPPANVVWTVGKKRKSREGSMDCFEQDDKKP